jgi:hypothetical protein
MNRWAKNPTMKKWHLTPRTFGQAICGMPGTLYFEYGGVKVKTEPPHDKRCKRCASIEAHTRTQDSLCQIEQAGATLQHVLAAWQRHFG